MVVQMAPGCIDTVARDIAAPDSSDGEGAGVHGSIRIDAQIVATGLTLGGVAQPRVLWEQLADLVPVAGVVAPSGGIAIGRL